ncbi:MAG: hypothetical protein ACO3O6_12255, partial [Gemmobacter sp.]
ARADFIEAARTEAAERAAAAAEARFAALDADGDGILSAAEALRGGGPLAMFDRLDRNGDGVLSSEEAAAGAARGGRQGGDHGGKHGGKDRHAHERGQTGGAAPRAGAGD